MPISIGTVGGTINLLAINIEVEANTVGDDGHRVFLTQASIDLEGGATGYALTLDLLAIAVVEVVTLVVLADAKEIILAACTVTSEDDAAAVTFYDGHVYRDGEIAKGRMSQETGVEHCAL